MSSSTSLTRRHWGRNRGRAITSTVLPLEVCLHDLAYVGETLLLARRGLQGVDGVGRAEEHGVVDDDVVVGPAGGKSVIDLLACNSAISPSHSTNSQRPRKRATHVRLIASKISCASLPTPLFFCASLFFISRIVCSSRALMASMSTLEMLGSAPSNPGAEPEARSPMPMSSKLRMCAKGMMW
jgi:hypothetical protein